ncbi:hypothetical protein AGMMS49992_12600 [Clostridia bacterium]|nr:hypothetical protein AGMMS49992_12600 [Clostridia bacterium]
MKEGDTLILDNASAHKVGTVMEPLIEKGINVIFLPPYSPEYNPIELAWSKMKAYLRKEKARTAEDLVCAIGKALETLTNDDCLGWVKHCGYGL